MNRRPPFVVNRFARHLANSGDYVAFDALLHHWTGTHWEHIDEKKLEQLAYAWLCDNEEEDRATPSNSKNAAKAATLHLQPVPSRQPDTIIIPVNNGCIHIDGETVRLEPHDKTIVIRHCIKCDYDPDAPTPTQFLRFIEEILPDEDVRNRVQEYIGYMFVPDARFQHSQLWLGSGANGKSALANIVQALHEKTTAVQMDKLDGFMLTGLIGATLAYCDEAPQRSFNETTIKSLIAGESVQVNLKYRDPVTYRSYAKWLVLANHFPAVTDHSEGFWRRWDVVPFTVTIPPERRDSELAKRIIRDELGGVLNWALAGMLRLLRRGHFEASAPAAIQDAILKAKLHTDSVAGWWEETFKVLSPIVRTEKTRAYSNYADWARASGMTPVSAPKFWERIEKITKGLVVFRKVRGLRYCNIELQPETE